MKETFFCILNFFVFPLKPPSKEVPMNIILLHGLGQSPAAWEEVIKGSPLLQDSLCLLYTSDAADEL